MATGNRVDRPYKRLLRNRRKNGTEGLARPRTDIRGKGLLRAIDLDWLRRPTGKQLCVDSLMATQIPPSMATSNSHT